MPTCSRCGGDGDLGPCTHCVNGRYKDNWWDEDDRECFHCSGSGKDECPACSGTGRLSDEDHEFYDQMHNYRECPECDGHGHIKKIDLLAPYSPDYYVECDRCDGKGKIPN
ncbi:MAG: zinc finger domain-containing protein [Candidatus Paceibacterota bacterium]|jgi:DnaJ-class molecular chaperone